LQENYLFKHYNDLKSLLHFINKQKKMAKQIKKENLPEKICLTCGRPFAWRKKWEKVWEEVKYCSDRCRNEKKKSPT
jgi:hypothetical protein